MLNIALLGSTGSIGTQALEVIASHPDLFRVCALSAHSNVELLCRQAAEFRPDWVAITSGTKTQSLAKAEAVVFPAGTKVFHGPEALLHIAGHSAADVVLNSLVGFAGLAPSLAAIHAGKTLALANKETLVAAGHLVMAEAARLDVSVIPVDSEHSAIMQCLRGESSSELYRLLLTASGGPFRGRTRQQLADVTLSECLKHPNWAMGRKITIDSATLMNKGLEVIEAHWLFGVDYANIEVVVHPQSIVHSMVEFRDGAVIGQLGLPDMRLPIQYALSGGERLSSRFPRMDFRHPLSLTFEAPDMVTFTALALAFHAGKRGGTHPCVLNAANEVCVESFIAGKIKFMEIVEIVEAVLSVHVEDYDLSLEGFTLADTWARKAAEKFVFKAVNK